MTNFTILTISLNMYLRNSDMWEIPLKASVQKPFQNFFE